MLEIKMWFGETVAVWDGDNNLASFSSRSDAELFVWVKEWQVKELQEEWRSYESTRTDMPKEAIIEKMREAADSDVQPDRYPSRKTREEIREYAGKKWSDVQPDAVIDKT